MFGVPRTNVIESSDFSVATVSPWVIRYCEAERCIDIDMELTVVPGSSIREGSIQRWLPSGEPVSRPERLRVIRNIKAAFAWRGLRMEVVAPQWPDTRPSVLDDPTP